MKIRFQRPENENLNENFLLYVNRIITMYIVDLLTDVAHPITLQT